MLKQFSLLGVTDKSRFVDEIATNWKMEREKMGQ